MRAREYLDFVVRVEQAAELGSYRVALVSSPAGEASVTVTLPFGADDFRRRLRIVEAARGAGARRSGPASAPEADEVGLRNVEQLGQELFRNLFSGDVLTCFHGSRERARHEGKGLRLRLRIQAPELAALPWEYLIDNQNKRLTLSSETPLVRHLEMPAAAPKLKIQPPVRVLGMIGSSTGLDVGREKQLMERAVEHLVRAGTMELQWINGHGWRHLQTAMRETWHVFHFIGHGSFDKSSGTGSILLEAEADSGQTEHALAADDLARLLGDNSALRLVVLNSCEGARASQTSLLSSTGATLAAHGIPAVVSMQYEISDRAALEFSRSFYDSLASGMPVETAVAEARNSIDITIGKTVEWGTPVLHMRSSDGLLFELDIRSALFPTPAPGKAEAATPPAPAASRPTGGSVSSGVSGAGRSILLRKVNDYWIKGVLQKKLEQIARLELSMADMGGDVNSPFSEFTGAVETAEGTPPSGATPGEMMDQWGSLLILGEPGSGKTVAMLEVARDMVARAEGDSNHGIPVVFNLSSWAVRKDPLDAWLTSELTAKFQVPKLVGQSWVKEGRIVPLLDGLDEVATAARLECLDAINTWLSNACTGVVVCCRFREYRALEHKLNLNAAIRLEPLTRDQVFTHLERGGPPLERLRLLLERDSGLLIDARTPLMLALMVRALSGATIDPQALASEQGLAARRSMVMDLFVKREFQRAREGGSLL